MSDAAAAVEVVVYGAPDCSLCSEATAVLRAAAARLGFALQEVDVTGDARLEARYREHLPVVEIDGRREFVYHVSPVMLERRIRDAQARRLDAAS